MQIFEFPTENLLSAGFKLLMDKHVCRIFSISDKKMVCVPRPGSVDEELCSEMGYMVKNFLYNGGVIVVEEGDVDIADFGVPGNAFKDRFFQFFTEWLRSKGLDSKIDGNDITVDGYKVCGFGFRKHNQIDYTTIHIGINTNIESIEKICTKKMKKVPGGLGRYGITGEDIREMFVAFCEQCLTEEIEWIKMDHC